jgi:hypothetical protein
MWLLLPDNFPAVRAPAPVCSKLGMSHALAGTIQKITLAWDERQKARELKAGVAGRLAAATSTLSSRAGEPTDA